MKTRHLLMPAALVVICLAGSPIYGQYASLSLDLKFILFASDEGRNMYPAPKEDDIGIVFAKGTSSEFLTGAKLGQLFNLNKVRMAGEAEIGIHWPGEDIPSSRIAHAVRVNGRDFLIVLFPDKISFKENAYTFKAEVYELDPKAGAGAKRICGENVDLNAFGFVGFYFRDKTYFLTVNLLSSGWGASILRPSISTVMEPTSKKKCP